MRITSKRFATTAASLALLAGPGTAIVAAAPASAATPTAAVASKARAAASDKTPKKAKHRVVARASSVLSCVTYGRSLVGFATSGNPYLAVSAALSAGGCGASLASGICYGSRQWWGAANRTIVWVATWGRYTRC